MKELTPFEGFQEHTLSLSVCFLLHKASLLSYSLSAPFCIAHCSPATTRKGDGLACGGSIPSADFSLPSYKQQFCWQTFFLSCCLTWEKWTLVRKQGALIFLFSQDCQNGFRRVQKQCGVLGFSPSHGDLTKSAWKLIGRTPFTLFHLLATITPLTAVTALGQAKGERKAKVYLKSLPRPWEEEIIEQFVSCQSCACSQITGHTMQF